MGALLFRALLLCIDSDRALIEKYAEAQKPARQRLHTPRIFQKNLKKVQKQL
jgi:hypothetical protein